MHKHLLKPGHSIVIYTVYAIYKGKQHHQINRKLIFCCPSNFECKSMCGHLQLKCARLLVSSASSHFICKNSPSWSYILHTGVSYHIISIYYPNLNWFVIIIVIYLKWLIIHMLHLFTENCLLQHCKVKWFFTDLLRLCKIKNDGSLCLPNIFCFTQERK